jgi:hypothetical protein
MKTGNSSYVAKLFAETTKATFHLEEKERKRERERLHVVTDRQYSCLLDSVLRPTGTVLPHIFVLTFPKVFW